MKDLFMEPDELTKKTILIADSDRSIRSLVATVLRGAGFVVLEASGVCEAFEAASCDEIDCLLIDMSFPGSGRVADVLKRVNPGLKIVFISKGPDAAQQSKRSWFLMKPYTVSELLDVVVSAAMA